MLDNAFRGGRKYWGLLAFWGLLVMVGLLAYTRQYSEGLTVTNMSRDVSWGLYIAQFTFMVGVAASAVMVVLPYYLHNFKAFGRMVILGEFLAVSAVMMCTLFIFVDVGQPKRMMNVMLYPTLNSPMFWDSVSLMGYMMINLVVGCVVFDAERKGAPPPGWVKPLIYLSIPWALSIHTVTAFLYSGLAARPFWLTAVLAPRFLASAFAAGPSLLIILALILRKFTKFDAGREAISKLATIVAYAMVINLFLFLVELFTALYSGSHHHSVSFEYLFMGITDEAGRHGALVGLMWVSAILNVVCVVLLLAPGVRQSHGFLPFLCAGVIAAIWIEKGMCMVVTGFIPSPEGVVTEYMPSIIEVLVTLGVYGAGFMVLTILYKIVTNVRERTEQLRMKSEE